MTVEIVEFSEPDRARLNELYAEVRNANFSNYNAQDESLSTFDNVTQGELILVAKSSNSIVGFVSAWQPDNFIHNLYVDSNYQNQGIGIQLLNAMALKLSYPLTLKCLKENIAATRFYKRHGWNVIGAGKSNDGDYLLFEYNGNE